MFEVRKSPIHGKGIFATEPINKGQYIGQYIARRTMRDDTYVLWVEDEKTKKWIGYDGYGRLKYLNHSSKPNAEFDVRDLFATKKIKPGEEITFHYGDEWDDVE